MNHFPLAITLTLTATPAFAQSQTQCFQTAPGMVQCQTYAGTPVQAPVSNAGYDAMVAHLLNPRIAEAAQQGYHEGQCQRAARLNVYAQGC